jgi:hypothetical protein
MNTINKGKSVIDSTKLKVHIFAKRSFSIGVRPEITGCKKAEKIGSDPLSVRIWSQNKRQQVKLQREREEAQVAALAMKGANEAIYRERQLQDVAKKEV